MTETAMLELETIPEPPRLRRHVADGMCVVEYGPQVLFCFKVADKGMRNVAVVAVTDAKVAVKDAAAVFGLTPEYVSELRGRARKEGSAGLVKAMGRPPILSPHQVLKVRERAGRGVTQTALARQFKVSRPVIADVLARHGAIAAQPPLADDLLHDGDLPDGDGQGDLPDGDGQGDLPDGDGQDDLPDGDGDLPDGDGQDDLPDGAGPAKELAPDAGLPSAPVVPGPVVEPGSGRIQTGTVACRYAGAMLAHAFLDRVGAEAVFASMQVRRPGRAGPVVFDDVALLCATTLAFGLGTSSVEGAKHLNRAQAGALAGLSMLPELRTLRPRLAAIADAGDPLAVQTRLAAAMLAADAPALGVYFVDDHFVPYAGAKPFGKGWNTKRKSAMPGRADTLVTDIRGRAVAFVTGEPSGLSKTLPPVLAQLRQITGPDAPIMLGFDRGGAYASVFTACRDANADWVTYRRAPLAPTTTAPQGHTYVDPDGVAVRVVLADEQVDFKDYGTARQLTLVEHGQPVLQVLTSDTLAPAAALLSWLRARWRIENAFKDLAAHHGIDWLCDYTAELVPDTTPTRNPARDAANRTRATAQDEHDAAGLALAALATATTRPVANTNQALPAAQERLHRATTALTAAEQALKAIPAKIPANQVTPGLMRALPHVRRRSLQMVLRLLAYNAELWLADHLNTYLSDNDEYRAHLRNILHLPGTIDYTPDTITVTLDQPDTPRLARALTRLIEEITHTPPRLPGDTRPITYGLGRT